MSAAVNEPSRDRRRVEVSVSIRTILVVAAAVALGWALSSITGVLLVIFVSLFSVAVLSPVVTAMQQRSGRSRGLCATVLVLALVIASEPSRWCWCRR